MDTDSKESVPVRENGLGARFGLGLTTALCLIILGRYASPFRM